MMVEFAAVVQMLVHSIQARCLPVALGIADLFLGNFLRISQLRTHAL